jgi:hypothetical protein
MTAQFPNDEIDGMMRPIVHIWSARLDAENRLKLTNLGTALLRDVGAKMPGFVEGQVFESDDTKSMIVITSWETRHAWATALWNEKVDQLLATVERSAKISDVICYPVATIVPTKA